MCILNCKLKYGKVAFFQNGDIYDDSADFCLEAKEKVFVALYDHFFNNIPGHSIQTAIRLVSPLSRNPIQDLEAVDSDEWVTRHPK